MHLEYPLRHAFRLASVSPLDGRIPQGSDVVNGPLPYGFWWSDLANTDSKSRADFRSTLVSLIAFDPDEKPHGVGTAVIIGRGSGFALALSAKHVLDYAHSIHRPHPKFALSTPAEFLSPVVPSIAPERLLGAWMGNGRALMLRVGYVSFAQHDLMAIILQVQNEDDFKKFTPAVLGLDLAVPKVGDVVNVLTLSGLKVTETEYDGKGKARGMEIENACAMFQGVVTQVCLGGLDQHKMACFTISVPTEKGMSGGAAYIVGGDGEPIGVCGIISSDRYSPSYTDKYQCGESLIMCAFVGLALELPKTMSNDGERMTIYEAIKNRVVPTPIGGMEEFEVIRDGNDFIIKCPPSHRPA